jgi:hypothetical protein
VITTDATQAAWIARRRPAESGRRSSIAPTMAIAIAAAATTAISPEPRPVAITTSPAATKAAHRTAIPPPWGVGTRWLERAFGLANA